MEKFSGSKVSGWLERRGQRQFTVRRRIGEPFHSAPVFPNDPNKNSSIFVGSKHDNGSIVDIYHDLDSRNFDHTLLILSGLETERIKEEVDKLGRMGYVTGIVREITTGNKEVLYLLGVKEKNTPFPEVL